MELKIDYKNGNTQIKQFVINSGYGTPLIVSSFMLLMNFYFITVSYCAIFVLVILVPFYLYSLRYAIFKNKIIVNREMLLFEQGFFQFIFKKCISKSNFQFLEVEEIEVRKKPVFLLKIFYEGKKAVLLKTMDIAECKYVKELLYKNLNSEE